MVEEAQEAVQPFEHATLSPVATRRRCAIARPPLVLPPPLQALTCHRARVAMCSRSTKSGTHCDLVAQRHRVKRPQHPHACRQLSVQELAQAPLHIAAVEMATS
eukprot:350964-Chlamydomonas_euryale.AAC.2